MTRSPDSRSPSANRTLRNEPACSKEYQWLFKTQIARSAKVAVGSPSGWKAMALKAPQSLPLPAFRGKPDAARNDGDFPRDFKRLCGKGQLDSEPYQLPMVKPKVGPIDGAKTGCLEQLWTSGRYENLIGCTSHEAIDGARPLRVELARNIVQ